MSDSSTAEQDTPQEPTGAPVTEFQDVGVELGGSELEGSQNASYGEPSFTNDFYEDADKPTKSTFVDDYFDDEAFLAGDDKTLTAEDDFAIFQQMENVVSWKVLNFYKDNGSPRGKRSLRNEPPVLQISSSDGAAAEFFVTNELAASLGKIFGDIDKSYRGVDITTDSTPVFSQEGVKRKLSSMVDWVSANKIKAFMLSVIVVLLIVSAIIYS